MAARPHAELAGRMYLTETERQQRLVYSETQKGSVLISEAERRQRP